MPAKDLAAPPAPGRPLLRETLSGGSRTLTLAQITPLGRIDRSGPVRVLASVDGAAFTEIGAHGGGRTALYLRLDAQGDAQVTVYPGQGYVALPEEGWSDAFKRYQGWTGADGIYAINIGDGQDCFGRGDTRTLFFFSDTLISQVDRASLQRQGTVYMPNNTCAILEGPDPHRPGALRFQYPAYNQGKPVAVIAPSPDCYDFDGAGEDRSKAYFWLKDGVVLGDKLFFMTSLITEDPAGPEGFQFRSLGVCLCETDLAGGDPDIAGAKQYAVPLACQEGEFDVNYGGCILPYTPAAGFPQGDGYVYVYGHIRFRKGEPLSACVARVRPEAFADWRQWRFYDGKAFVPQIVRSAPILGHISPEMSVTPLTAGANAGKFLAVFQYDTNSDYVAYAIGQSPVGPFAPPQRVYYTGGDRTASSVYMYNAKAHPHLSTPQRILASYNVNCTAWQHTLENGHIYRPRFITLVETETVPNSPR
jgi:hypothetical protein